MSGRNAATATSMAGALPAGHGPADAAAVPCAANKDPQLRVKVYARVKGKKQPVQATVTANALSQASGGGGGLADFSYVQPATYTVQATAILSPDDKDYYAAGDQKVVSLAKGDDRTVEIEVKPKNKVTPKLELEYRVVLFDRGLTQHQVTAAEPAADLLPPDPTYVQVSLETTNDEVPYTGDGTLSAAGCDVFLDQACTQSLAGRKLTNAELTAKPATRVYLRGTARGTFNLTLTLDPSPDARNDVQPPATEAMGVVGLDLEIHQHVTPVTVSAATYPLKGKCADLEKGDLIPKQVTISDQDKVVKGRVLHQQHKGMHGRAKIKVKLTAAEWPAGTDDYLVMLETTGSDLRAYDAKFDGKKQSLPLKLKVSDLKGGEKKYWIEGHKISEKVRDARLSLTLDRPSGGLSKSPKANADWGRFTVVKIESVKLEYTDPGAGNPRPWNASKRRWYINYQAGDAGRKLKFKVKLSKPISDVKLHCMLSPDENNLKKKNWGIDVPGGWNWGNVTGDVKQKDKANATDLLHHSKDTDANGEAEIELILSRFGGDIFWPAAYIAQDPHLAAYVHGHDELKKRKPKHCDHHIKVWRKFAYQKIKVEGRNYPGTKPSRGVYGRVRAEMFKLDSVTKSKSQVQALALPSLLPEYMFKAGGGKKLRLNVSDANCTQFFNMAVPNGEHPILVPVVTCDFNWAEERDSGVIVGINDVPASQFPKNVRTDVHVCNPPLQGGQLLVTGDWDAWERDHTGAKTNHRNGQLASGDVDVDAKRGHINDVQVKLPNIANVTANTVVTISNLVVQGAPEDYLGGYNCDPANSRAVVALYDPSNSQDYQNTIVHELGHAFHQTLGVAPAGGIPPNPNYLNTPTGPHCGYNTDKCVMYTSGPIAGSLNRYCPDCHPYVLVQDMTSLS